MRFGDVDRLVGGLPVSARTSRLLVLVARNLRVALDGDDGRGRQGRAYPDASARRVSWSDGSGRRTALRGAGQRSSWP
jgi:hypothetical protein